MPGKKTQQEICLIGRIFSMEVLVLVMGVASLVNGLVERRPLSIAIGLVLLTALIVLNLLCRRWGRR